MITIYRARRILTMNPSRPEADHVAVRDGLILGAGQLDELTGWGDWRLDTTFADMVLMPGFVEGHSHMVEGTFWRYVYCGYFDRTDPSGKVWPGLPSIPDIVARLKETSDSLADPTVAMSGWGLDPIYFGTERVSRAHLDQVSTTRPIGVLHASGHILNVNTKALELADMLRPGINHPGVPLGPDGLPTGELLGPEAMMTVNGQVGFNADILAGDELGLRQFARLCVRKGVTTATDLASMATDETVDMLVRVTGDAKFPARIVTFRRLLGMPVPDVIALAAKLKGRSTDRSRLGRVKMFADGSIQGFTARIKAPGYYNGAPNGLWYIAPEQLREALTLALKHDVQVNVHTNGDEATELMLDCMEAALKVHPTPDHRFTIQHGQMANAAQFRRMKALGLCINLFPNHHFYWGDQHYAITLGPERAERMNACATALAHGVPLAIHSDAPVTPLGPLFTAWCAVNRLTATGRVLGANERISVADALRTITMGAAYTLKLDHEIGSIEAGKKADFAVLEDDPLTIAPEKLRDVRIWGTVQDGRLFAAKDI